MYIRKIGLLLFGVLGSAVAATALFISAESGLPMPQPQPVSAAISQPTAVPQCSQTVSLPAGVLGTSLMAMKLTSYEGPFLEDGSDREVVNIAALIVYNAGSRNVDAAQITLQMEDKEYCFYGENFPAGETVVLLEQNAAAYCKKELRSCAGWQIVSDTDPAAGECLAITDGKNGELLVENSSGAPLHDLHIYYKSWLSPPDYYMGGISRCLVIPGLEPGQTVVLYPEHYAAGYSKIVEITADNS